MFSPAKPEIFVNPLQDSSHLTKNADPCILVIFGATGDLTARRLVPAIYNLAREGQLPAHFACVGFARREKSNDDFRHEMHAAIEKYSRVKPVDPELWKTFSQQIYYHRAEFHEDEGYASLDALLKELDSQLGTKGNRVFYLSTPASYFPTIVEKLGSHKLLYTDKGLHNPWSRVIIEKPFGQDLDSALALQTHITQFAEEKQLYRIDHWLGKETVQNLLVLRFGNPIFESIWSHQHIDHVQISVAEEQGIGTRGRLWEESGMLRDIVQNHMMQLLSIVGMEPPENLEADAIKNEKVKLLNAVRPMAAEDVDKYVVRGQYAKGLSNGQEVGGYRQEANVPPDSNVETFVAMQLFIDNERWTGVPFYLRAGKYMPKRVTEIAIAFKRAPYFPFIEGNHTSEGNVLVIRIQPDEGISLKMTCKVPGSHMSLQPVKMDFRYGSYFGLTTPEAYERLIWDCMAGDNTLFARNDEVFASWKLMTPVLKSWQDNHQTDFPNYAAGSWGPDASEELLAKDNRKWRIL